MDFWIDDFGIVGGHYSITPVIHYSILHHSTILTIILTSNSATYLSNSILRRPVPEEVETS